MTKKTVRTGIVGSGFSATFHFDALQKVHGTDVEVVGVYSKDGNQAAAYAEARGIRAMESLESLIDAADVIHACVPPVAHEPTAIAALAAGKFVVCEKPLTGYFGDGSPDFHWDRADKQVALESAMASVERILEAERASRGRLLYAENWVYAPAVQKEREILEKTGGQILWMHGEEAHSGSHSVDYAYAARCGGGVLIGKGCHPLSAALYLKRVEGRARQGKPIRPRSVSARCHALTRLENFRDEGHIRTDYYDIEDFSMMHVEFDDGTIGHYTHAFRILEKYRLKGSFGVVTGVFAKPGRLTAEQVVEMHRAGHEIHDHTFDHNAAFWGDPANRAAWVADISSCIPAISLKRGRILAPIASCTAANRRWRGP